MVEQLRPWMVLRYTDTSKTVAAKNVGAVAFSRTGNPNMGGFSDAVVLFTAGVVPDEIPAG